MDTTLISVLITILGIIMGSFYACMGYRIPNKISTIKVGSFCPECKTKLKWYMNIPIFSYIFLGGKCAYCKKPISIMCPLIEISSGVLFLISYLSFGFTEYFFISIILSSCFLITVVSDFLYYYISDRVVVISLILLIIVLFIFNGYLSTFYSILYGIIMFLIMYLIKLLGDKLFKKESLGGGDIKLMGVIGLSLGIIPSLYVLIIASIIGLIFSLFIIKKNKNGIVPFGPFLLMASLIMLYFGDTLTSLLVI